MMFVFPRKGRTRKHGEPALAEHHRLGPVDQHPLLGDPAHRARENLRLDVAPGADQVVDRLAVVAALDRLFDDRPFVEVTGDEMRGRADQLHPALVRAVIRPRAIEAGSSEERRVGKECVSTCRYRWWPDM